MERRDRDKRELKKKKPAEMGDRELQAMTEEERDRYFDELRKKRKEKRLMKQKIKRRKKLAVLGAMAVVSVFVVAGSVRGITRFIIAKTSETEAKTQKDKDAGKTAEESKAVSAQTDLLAEAKRKAAQYDYDAAIQLLKSDQGYESNTEFQDAVKEFEETKASCKAWPLEEVTHIFYHTLIKDPSRSFDGDYKEGDYNQVMTTIDEFNKITQIMYCLLYTSDAADE